MLSFFPRDVLDEILDLIESVSYLLFLRDTCIITHITTKIKRKQGNQVLHKLHPEQENIVELTLFIKAYRICDHVIFRVKQNIGDFIVTTI